MKRDGTISQNTKNKPYVRPILFFGGFTAGVLVTAIVFSSEIHKNYSTKSSIIENGRNWNTHYNHQKAKLNSLETERDMLQAKCARLVEEKAKLEQKASTNQKQKKR